VAGKALPACENCGLKFRPDRYNHARQKYCCRPACKADRARARKRKSYGQRLEREEQFRETERTRCREAMRRIRAERKKAEKEAAAASSDLPPVPPFETLLTGLVSHVADTTDPDEVASLLRAYADRGRRLAVRDGSRGSP
jgi:hypothetical protein